MLDSQSLPNWQAYRDYHLLQVSSEQALLFNASLIESRPETISLICGKAHALKLVESDSLKWIDKDFALHTKRPLIVTPYFDYRQLSNIKLEALSKLIQQIS